MKKIFLLGVFAIASLAYAQAMEMKDGEERQTLEVITQPAWTENDQMLNEKIKTDLKDDLSLRKSLKYIQIETDNNVVYARGTVASEEEKRAIEEKVRSYPGVAEFASYIKVDGS